MPTLQALVGLLSHYGYVLLFPLAIVEGPIVTIIAAFLASEGYLNVFLVYATVVGADMLGDFVFYALGRWNAPFVRKHGHLLGVTPERLDKASAYYMKHHNKSLIISKTIHGIGVAGLVSAGLIKVPYWKYFKTCLMVTLIQSALLTAVGFFLGHAYTAIGQYLNYYAAGATAVVVMAGVLFFIYWKRND